MTPNTAWSPYPIGRVPAWKPLHVRADEVRGPRPTPYDLAYRMSTGAIRIPKSTPGVYDLEIDYKLTPRKKPRPDVGAERMFAFMYFCTRGKDMGTMPDGRRIGPYCGAPDGVRCSWCGSGFDGHDPGDEDPRKP